MKLSLKITKSGKGLKTGAEYEAAIKTAHNRAAELVRDDFDKTTSTWDSYISFKIENLDYSKQIYTVSEQYKFVNFGTKIRYAVMTPDFVAKTQAGVIQSRAGAGGLVIINKNAPRPGIKPRKFDERIRKSWEKKFPKLVLSAIKSV